MKTFRSKYCAKKTVVDEIKFDSQKEALRYIELKARQQAGEISDLRLQVPFVLIDKSEYGRSVKYVADFVYTENGKEVVEDVKGYKTDVYKLKKRMFQERYQREIKET